MSELAYLDTSVVVAYYVPEASSDRVQALYARLDRPVISGLVEVEIAAAVSMRLRIGDLEAQQAQRIVAMFDEHVVSGLYAPMHLEPAHYRWARDALARFDLPLKAPDALHLAAAAIGGFLLVTADRQLARNAEALNVACALIEA